MKATAPMCRAVEHRPVALHEVAQPFGNRQHPLAHRQAGKDVIRPVRRRLYHAPGIARGADAPAFGGRCTAPDGAAPAGNTIVIIERNLGVIKTVVG